MDQIQPIEKDEKDNLLGQTSIESQQKPMAQAAQENIQSSQTAKQQEDQIIDPIEELVKNNNALPLLVVIDQVDLERKVQDKPLLSILAQRFIPLPQILKGRQITFPLDDDRRTPLHYAIEADDVKAAAWLIQKGNPNQRDNFGHTPIIDAIRLGRQRIFLLCLKNKLYDERAPIFAAVYNKHWQLKVLHGMGINIFAYRDEENKSAFERALQYNSFECAQFMIKIRPDLDVDQFKNFTQSQGLIRRIKRIQNSLSVGQRTKQIIRPLLILLVLYLGLNGSWLGYENLYESTRPFYLIVFAIIGGLYGLTYLFGTLFTSKVQYTEKHTLSQILREPNYTTLEEICPMCVHLTHFRYDHCYVCGYCVEKFHIHSFVCIHKANQVFWILGEFVWLYLNWAILHEFCQFIQWTEISIQSVSSFTLIKFLATIEHLIAERKFIAFMWLAFLVFLFLYQLIYCLTLTGMMCMRRKFQEVIQTQKYLHLYHVVKVDENYMNKEKKIFERGLFGGIKRCVRNLLIYFFVSD